ncbi:hypothetical protein [Domibacillus indicus]|uniref:hypothetical protein n=1 Tax=Domibacillus indicus TaxID=1437523 RepID=UPI0018CDA196|nr:hypothetical protein [Domibacillus indicus]
MNDIKKPAFPSPSSCLPEEEQEELEAKIEEANDLLLNLALSNEQSEEGRRVSFEGLIGQWAEVILIREAEKDMAAAEETGDQATKSNIRKSILLKKNLAVRQTAKSRAVSPKANIRRKKLSQKAARKSTALFYKQSGRVEVAGRDFVLLKKKEQEIIIPFLKIQVVKSFTRHPGLDKEPALLNIDPALRRLLMFQFGETVASSPALLHLFFKITLPIFLLGYLHKNVKVILPGQVITGVIHEVDQEAVTVISIKKEQKIIIPLSAVQAIISSAF